MANIIIRNEDIEKAYNSLVKQSETVGKHEYSKSIFAQTGVNLRLEAFSDSINKQVVDEEAKAKQDAEQEAKKQELEAAAAAEGLSVDDYKLKLKAEERVNRIREIAENQHITITEAEEQVAKQEANELRWQKEEFVRNTLDEETRNKLDEDMNEYYDKVNEANSNTEESTPDENATFVNPMDVYVASINEEEFAAWQKQREVENEKLPDPMKTIVVVNKTKHLHVVYSFDENITGIAGYSIIADGKVEVANDVIPDTVELKNKLVNYIQSNEFIKGINFVARIAGTDIQVAVEG